MKCSQVREHLDDYLDGALSNSSQRAIDDHLGGCAACREEFASWRSLAAQARELVPAMQPNRDLWPQIEARIETRQHRPSTRWLQLAAAAITLAVLSIPLSVWWSGQSSEAPAPQARTAIEADSVILQAEMARSEDGVQLARTDLVTAIERHRDVVEDDTLRTWIDSMTLLDQAIGELRAALDEDPQNRRLRMLLASRYQQERRLLQKVSRV